MDKSSISNYAEVNGIRIHYMDYPGDGPVMLMAHSLSGNGLIFQGLIEAGLSPAFRVIAPDFRGRGFSDKPRAEYTLAEQTADMLALLDQLGIEKVTICGHSFGGYWGIYFAHHHPERVEGLVLLDVCIRLNPMTPMLVTLASGRLLRAYSSWEEFETMVKMAPFLTFWDDAMIHFLRADAEIKPDGRVVPRTFWMDAARAGSNIYSIPDNEWYHYLHRIVQPVMLVQAQEPFAFGQYIVDEGDLMRTAAILRACKHIRVAGNHVTMLFGEGARQIVAALKEHARIGTADGVPKKAMAEAF